jgi:hypothetical protein
MSIPLLFVPPEIDGRRVYDGGLRNNFPVSYFLKDHPGSPFIALYLRAPSETEKVWIGSDLIDILIDGEDREVVDANAASVVTIDTSPISTVDFNLSQLEKDFLLKIGKASALKFLGSRNLDDGPSEATVQAAIEEAEKCRQDVKGRRKEKKRQKLIISSALLVFFTICTLIGWSVRWILPEVIADKKANIDTLDGHFSLYRSLLNGQAATASNNEVHTRPQAIGFRWRQPRLFGVKCFELRLGSRAYELNGYAVEASAGGGWQARVVDKASPKAIAIALDTSSRAAYVFYRREIPVADHYDSEQGDPDLVWSIGRVGETSCSTGERSSRKH